jgi:hypothetical protein
LKNLKKLDFYTSTKLISKNGYVVKEKKEFLTNFDFFQSQRWKCWRKKFKAYAIFLS